MGFQPPAAPSDSWLTLTTQDQPKRTLFSFTPTSAEAQALIEKRRAREAAEQQAAQTRQGQVDRETWLLTTAKRLEEVDAKLATSLEDATAAWELIPKAPADTPEVESVRAHALALEERLLKAWAARVKSALKTLDGRDWAEVVADGKDFRAYKAAQERLYKLIDSSSAPENYRQSIGADAVMATQRVLTPLLLKFSPMNDVEPDDVRSYDSITSMLEACEEAAANLGMRDQVRKIQRRREELAANRGVYAKGKGWRLYDGTSDDHPIASTAIKIDAGALQEAETAFVDSLKACLEHDPMARALVADCSRCRWMVRKVKVRVDPSGTVLRVQVHASMIDAFGEHQAGHGEFRGSYLDLSRDDGRWRAKLSCPDIVTQIIGR